MKLPLLCYPLVKFDFFKWSLPPRLRFDNAWVNSNTNPFQQLPTKIRVPKVRTRDAGEIVSFEIRNVENV